VSLFSSEKICVSYSFLKARGHAKNSKIWANFDKQKNYPKLPKVLITETQILMVITMMLEKAL
jgi:hypothetical protein